MYWKPTNEHMVWGSMAASRGFETTVGWRAIPQGSFLYCTSENAAICQGVSEALSFVWQVLWKHDILALQCTAPSRCGHIHVVVTGMLGRPELIHMDVYHRPR